MNNIMNAIFGISYSTVCGFVVFILCDISHELGDLRIHEVKLDHPLLICINLLFRASHVY